MNRTDAAPKQKEGLSIVAQSPYELRVALGRDVPEVDVRTALATGDVGFLHSYTTGSTVDGPGVRVVAWTTGCHFRCQYCHNPDTWTLTNGIPVSVTRAVQELQKYRTGLKLMSGGFTLSGGEPLMQDRFAVKLMKAAKKLGIHTALDTNGALGKRLADVELKEVDLVLLDIKAWDPDRHRTVTGEEVTPVLEFAERLARLSRRMWIRFVLVPGLTDNVSDIREIANFAAGLGDCVQRVQVLPFHQMGRYKWQNLKIDYKLKDAAPPSLSEVERTCEIFRSAGLATD